jgi:hypothetical protein
MFQINGEAVAELKNTLSYKLEPIDGKEAAEESLRWNKYIMENTPKRCLCFTIKNRQAKGLRKYIKGLRSHK